MTTQSVFTPDEWTLIVRVPRWVVSGASAAERHNAHRTRKRVEAGFIAIAEGRAMGNEFVREVAHACMDFFDTTLAQTGITVSEPELALTTLLERLGAAARAVRTKANPSDAAAYRQWIIEITDVVINAGQSDGVFGIGRVVVTRAEKQFRDQVVLALQS